ncbi:MAG: DUF4434 domain-containing protein, partial [Planctomycetes bacterium]|nr:DUF4434 domain-containing protein [Planctomycetota bacterium]
MKITGTFIDTSVKTNHPEPLDKSASWWLQELTDMKQAGIDTVILQHTMCRGKTHFLSMHYEEWLETDTLDAIMCAAAECKIDVYIGLYNNVQFWDQHKDFSRMMKRDQQIYKNLLDELIPRYKGHAQLKGIYLPSEADKENCYNAERSKAVRDFFVNVYQYSKELSDLPILMSPYYTLKFTPEVTAEWWDELLKDRLVDIVAMQDGVGCVRNIQPDDSSRYYQPL